MKDEMGKVCFTKSTRNTSKSQESKGVPLVIIFHSKFKLIWQLLPKHLHILYMDQEPTKVFTSGSMVTFLSACSYSVVTLQGQNCIT